MRILRAVVHQQQDFRRADRVGQQVQQFLGGLINPMKVLEDHHQRLIEALAQQQPLDRVQRAALANLRVHLGEGINRFGNSEQSKQVRDGILEGTIERENFAVNLLAPRARIVFARDLEVRVQQVDDRQV